MNLLGAAAIPVKMFQKPATLISPGGAYVDGRWVENPTSAAILAVIQAPTAHELRQMPADEKLDGLVSIWTFADIKTTDEDAGTAAQLIETPEGVTYRIIRATRRTEAGFTRAIGRLHNDQGRSV